MSPFTAAAPQRTAYLLLVGILIFAAFLRFYHLAPTPPGLYTDEAMDGNNAAEVAATGAYQAFYPEDNGREGLYVNSIAVLFRYFHAPHEAWVVRLPAAIAGVLTIPAMFLLVGEFFGTSAGLLAAFLMATSFWHINFSRIGFRAILAPLFITWALYLMIRAFRSESSRAGWVWAIAAGAVYSLGFYTYIAYRVTPLLLLLFIPIYRTHPGFWKRAAAFTLASLAVAAPLGLYFFNHPGTFMGRVSQISVLDNAHPLREFFVNLGKTALMFNLLGDMNWRHNVSGAPELFWPVGILFLIGIGLGIRQLARGIAQQCAGGAVQASASDFGWMLLFSWMLLTALPAAIADEGVPHALRAILMLPPAIALAAAGGDWAHGRVSQWLGRRAGLCAATIFLLAVGIFGYVDYFIVWGRSADVPQAFFTRWVNLARQIDAVPAGTPKYVVVYGGGIPVRGVPASAEATMFITNSFLPEQQAAENIHYLLPSQARSIPAGAAVFYVR